VDIISGNSPAIYHPSNTGVYPFVKVDDMNLCSIYQSSSRLYSSVDRSLIPEGAIIFAKRGAAIATNKVRIAKCPLVIDSNMMALVAKKSIDSLFLYYSIFKEELWKIADTSTIPQINNKHIKPYKIPLPPLPEQKKIAEILSAWDRAVEQAGMLIDAKQRLKKVLMQQLLPGRMRFPEFGKPVQKKGELPEGWKKVKLGTLFKQVTRKNSAGVSHVLTASGEHGLVDQKDYFNRSVASQSLEGYYHLKRGEFAYNRSAMKGYPYGAIKRLDYYPEGVLSTLYLCFALSLQEQCSDFFMHYFESGHLNRQLRGIVQVGARAHGLLNVTASDFFTLKLPVPAYNEQTRIAAVLSTCDREIELLLRKEIVLREQKKGLMQKLLTGEIRVKVQENNG
jgi:type I restriction enzyme S subunit